MYKATKELIEQRQHFCTSQIKIAEVTNLGGGQVNDCYGNAWRLKNKNRNYFIVSGWFILPFNEVHKNVHVIQHWFNIDMRKKQYVDTSPVEKNAEYVVDMNLYEFCLKNNENLTTHVATSLIYEDDRFKTVREFNAYQQIVTEIDMLTTENLYHHCLK